MRAHEKIHRAKKRRKYKRKKKNEKDGIRKFLKKIRCETYDQRNEDVKETTLPIICPELEMNQVRKITIQMFANFGFSISPCINTLMHISNTKKSAAVWIRARRIRL